MEYFELENARSWIKAAALLITENAAMLTGLDTAIGDGDHGENMMRGFKAIEKKAETLPPPANLAALFKFVGMTLLSSVGGAAGPGVAEVDVSELNQHAAPSTTILL